MELFSRSLTNNMVSKYELKLLKKEFLFKDCNTKEFEHRKKVYHILQKTLLYLGILDNTIQQTNDSQIKGLKCNFQPSDLYSDHSKVWDTVKEREYLRQRRADYIIDFKKEPSKINTQSFDNSGFAMFKGRNWRFFMQKLYCVVGRSPANYKQKATEQKIKVVWHVDVDLGHIRKVSRQHALIIFNFEKWCFEIKCLSRKYPVYVNRIPLMFEEDPLPIYSGTLIVISSESFFFMLPAT